MVEIKQYRCNLCGELLPTDIYGNSIGRALIRTSKGFENVEFNRAQIHICRNCDKHMAFWRQG